MSMTELAERIHAHLKRFERDPQINPGWRIDPETKSKVSDPRGLYDFYCAGARRAGNRVKVTYVVYQGPCSLKREEAERYLAWLDAGNVGQHFQVAQEIAQ